MGLTCDPKRTEVRWKGRVGSCPRGRFCHCWKRSFETLWSCPSHPLWFSYSPHARNRREGERGARGGRRRREEEVEPELDRRGLGRGERDAARHRQREGRQ